MLDGATQSPNNYACGVIVINLFKHLNGYIISALLCLTSINTLYTARIQNLNDSCDISTK